jgi:hypothetical protein
MTTPTPPPPQQNLTHRLKSVAFLAIMAHSLFSERVTVYTHKRTFCKYGPE